MSETSEPASSDRVTVLTGATDPDYQGETVAGTLTGQDNLGLKSTSSQGTSWYSVLPSSVAKERKEVLYKKRLLRFQIFQKGKV